MVAGGRPARRRVVLSLSVGGAVVGSAVLGASTCCTPPVPPEVPPPVPTVVVDASPDGPETGPDGSPDAGDKCIFTTPRARGGPKRTGRIVGGTPAPNGAYPFAVAIATPGRRHYCGGSIVTGRSVVTASHCMVEPGDLVLFGSTDLRKASAVRVTESRLHPQYDPGTFDYDVAVAVLEIDIGMPAVPLADGITSLDATAVGWGRTSETGSTTQHLREVSLPLWENDDCRLAYPTLTDRMVCAGGTAHQKDACSGDSGGPLLTWNVDHWELLGVTSHGVGCAREGFPGVWADVRGELGEWVRRCAK
jgi:trypsin